MSRHALKAADFLVHAERATSLQARRPYQHSRHQHTFAPSKHASPRMPSSPSFTSHGTMKRAASGSSHHQPNAATATSPTSAVRLRYEHATVSFASAASTGRSPAPRPRVSRRRALHDRQRRHQQCDPHRRFFGTFASRDGDHDLEHDCRCKNQERPADEPERLSFRPLPGILIAVRKSPDDGAGRSDFHIAVSSESHQNEAPGGDSLE